jgi:protein-serine/threonine kinase
VSRDVGRSLSHRSSGPLRSCSRSTLHTTSGAGSLQCAHPHHLAAVSPHSLFSLILHASAANMPSANALLPPSRTSADDDNPDQIGSNSSTPPGAATPRPDPTDKRLPGILHSYFGQVCDSLLPRRTSAVNPSPAPPPSTSAAECAHDGATKEKDAEASRLHSHTLPSPTPSASSRHPSSSQLKGEPEKLTEGAFAPPRNQATPPQTPRSRSQEGKPPTSNLSSTSLNARVKEKDTKGPAVGPPKGKLSVVISEGRGLRPSVDPYVVCQFQWAEYISEGPRNDAPPKKGAEGRNAGGLVMRRQDSQMGTPMAIPMRSRQSSNSGTSSDPRENGTFKEVTNPKWEHDAIL